MLSKQMGMYSSVNNATKTKLLLVKLEVFLQSHSVIRYNSLRFISCRCLELYLKPSPPCNKFNLYQLINNLFYHKANSGDLSIWRGINGRYVK